MLYVDPLSSPLDISDLVRWIVLGNKESNVKGLNSYSWKLIRSRRYLLRVPRPRDSREPRLMVAAFS